MFVEILNAKLINELMFILLELIVLLDASEESSEKLVPSRSLFLA